MKIRLLSCLIFFSLHSYGQDAQDSCTYNFNTNTILGNKNLKRFVNSIQVAKLVRKNDKKYIPETLIETINCWKKQSGQRAFIIANPNEPCNLTDIITEGFPDRQIIYLGVSKNYLLMTYRYGGGLGISHHIMIVKFEEGKIIDFWVGLGSDLKTKAEVLSYIKKNEKSLQTKYVDM